MPLERHPALLALGAVQQGLRERRGLSWTALADRVRAQSGIAIERRQVRQLESVGISAWAKRLACLEALGAEVQFMVLTPEDAPHVEMGTFTAPDGTPLTLSVRRREAGVDEYFLTDTDLGDAVAGPLTADAMLMYFMDEKEEKQDALQTNRPE